MPDTPSTAPHTHRAPKETVQDILISIIIAFALAFVFRGFVIEAFVIPTGSMAPTLEGAMSTYRSPQSGHTWQVGPQMRADGNGNSAPQPTQSGTLVHDPMTGFEMNAAAQPLQAGDRILVLKYLYLLFEPERFDVVVFKSPVKPQTNFIKRLTGLPSEEIALIDGDVFTRSAKDAAASPDGAARWSSAGWKIARKPALVQNAVWQPVFNSAFAPLDPTSSGLRWYNIPWVPRKPGDPATAPPVSAGWKLDSAVYEYSSTAPAELTWDSTRPRFLNPRTPWAIDDFYEYNEITHPRSLNSNDNGFNTIPVSDVRLSASVQPQQEGLRFGASLVARQRQFEWSIEGTTAAIRVRNEPTSADPDPAWTIMDQATIKPLPVGLATPVEFWHVDQSLSLYIDGHLVAGGPQKAVYDWNPAQRIEKAMGQTVEQLLAAEALIAEQYRRQWERSGSQRATRLIPNIFSMTSYIDQATGLSRQNYREPRLWWSISGSPVKLFSVSVDRDLHYRPGLRPDARDNSFLPARGTHPDYPVVLTATQYFVCGDNSPASDDARSWDVPDPWVRRIDPTAGVVPADLMLGKAFFVYFPGMKARFVPDFGRMHFIW